MAFKNNFQKTGIDFSSQSSVPPEDIMDSDISNIESSSSISCLEDITDSENSVTGNENEFFETSDDESNDDLSETESYTFGNQSLLDHLISTPEIEAGANLHVEDFESFQLGSENGGSISDEVTVESSPKSPEDLDLREEIQGLLDCWSSESPTDSDSENEGGAYNFDTTHLPHGEDLLHNIKMAKKSYKEQLQIINDVYQPILDDLERDPRIDYDKFVYTVKIYELHKKRAKEEFTSECKILDIIFSMLKNGNSYTYSEHLKKVEKEVIDSLRESNMSKYLIECEVKKLQDVIISESYYRSRMPSKLLALLPLDQIKHLSNFEYMHIEEIAYKCRLPGIYKYTVKSYKTDSLVTYKVNMDPALQLFLVLARLAHRSTLKSLAYLLRISPSEISIVERGCIKTLLFLKGGLLDFKNCDISHEYLDLLIKSSPKPKGKSCEYIRPNTCLFVGSTAQKISALTIEDQSGTDLFYSEKNKIHCNRYQILCDSNGLILHCFNGKSGNIHDKILLEESGVLEKLYLLKLGNELLQVYGDAEYSGVEDEQFKSAHKELRNTPLSTAQKTENAQNRIHSTKIKKVLCQFYKLFEGLNLPYRNNIKMNDVDERFKIACLLFNCYIILYPTAVNYSLFPKAIKGGKRESNMTLTLSVYLNSWLLHNPNLVGDQLNIYNKYESTKIIRRGYDISSDYGIESDITDD